MPIAKVEPLTSARALRGAVDDRLAAEMADVGFVDLEGGNYRLSESSPYLGAALDGTDIGADIDAIAEATGLPL